MDEQLKQELISKLGQLKVENSELAVGTSSAQQALEKLDSYLGQFQRLLQGKPTKSLVTSDYNQLLLACSTWDRLALLNVSAELSTKLTDRLAESRELLTGLCRIVTDLYKQHETDFFATKDAEKSLKLTQILLRSFHNFTDKSDHFCFVLSGIEFFHADFARPALKSWLRKFEQMPHVEKLVLSTLGFVYNMFYRSNARIVANLSQFNFAELAKPYLTSSSMKVRIQAGTVVIFSANEDQANIFDGAVDVLKKLVEILADSASRSDRRSEYLGFHVIEAANIVRRLSLTDSNKRLLVKDLKLLPVLERLLGGQQDDEKSVAIDILFSLSFNEENSRDILQQLSGTITSLGQNTKWRTNRSFQGLAMKLKEMSEASATQVLQMAARMQEEEERAAAKVGQTQTGKHVMISYQHSDKQTVFAIRDGLKAAGIQVWIDNEQMSHGQTFDILAEAVESAYAVVICMSENYKNSDMCKNEATYAKQLKKRLVPVLLQQKYKPTGWLGFLLAADLYCDLSGKYPFEQKMRELVTTLQSCK